MLNLTKKLDQGNLTLCLAGRLDTVTAPQLEKELTEQMPGISALTLDMGALDYISSAGLRVLLMAQKQMSKKGGMKLVHVNETVLEIFEVTGFTDILDIEA